jgi:hypothetical protein
MAYPYTQIDTGLEQLVMLTCVRFHLRDGSSPLQTHGSADARDTR